MALRSIFLFSFQLANTLTSVCFTFQWIFPLKLQFSVNVHIITQTWMQKDTKIMLYKDAKPERARSARGYLI